MQSPRLSPSRARLGKAPPLSPVSPKGRISSQRTNPYRIKSQGVVVEGKIVPSDQAFIDMVLEKGESLPEGSQWIDFVTIESLTDKASDDANHSFAFIFTHTLRYNGEAIWTLETRSNCDGKGTWGQSSTCTLHRIRDGVLRVKIVHKGRTDLGDGWNTRENREYSLPDIIRQSGEARQAELMCQ